MSTQGVAQLVPASALNMNVSLRMSGILISSRSGWVRRRRKVHPGDRRCLCWTWRGSRQPPNSRNVVAQHAPTPPNKSQPAHVAHRDPHVQNVLCRLRWLKHVTTGAERPCRRRRWGWGEWRWATKAPAARAAGRRTSLELCYAMWLCSMIIFCFCFDSIDLLTTVIWIQLVFLSQKFFFSCFYCYTLTLN